MTSKDGLLAANDASVVPGRYWQLLADGRVECDLCPRYCRLHDGQRGLCFVRAREGDRMVLTTYGRSSGFCVDPIEKKPLYHFLPGTPVLSFGTAGCNLTCRYCQNWDITKSREIDTLADRATPATIARAARSLACPSVAFTYNDPVIFLEYAVDVARACRESGVRTVAVTAGYVTPEPRAEFFAAMDAANVDLKSFDEAFYHRVCSGHLQPVLDTIEYLVRETDVWVEVTTLLVPGQNDSDDEIDRLTGWLAELEPSVPMHFSAFHPDFKMLDVPPTPLATLQRARARALANGLRHVYVGNVHDSSADSTYCAECGTRVIERDWYTIGAYHLTDEGCCTACGAALAGVFDGPVGTWGARRLPVRLAEYDQDNGSGSATGKESGRVS
jgi:pyruvate formate lyase activating enzyme